MGGGGTFGRNGGNMPKVHGCGGGAGDRRQEAPGAVGRGGGGTAVFGRSMPPGGGEPMNLGDDGAGCAETGLCENGGSGGATNRGGASAGGGGKPG